MTNYQRLISYICVYEGEVKGKNTGFAKLEPRNGQCKLSANVRKVYVGGSDLGVCLLAPGKEIFLDSILIRSRDDEPRVVVNMENAADSGCSMDRCYGLTIYGQGGTWRVYTTIWEGAVAHAAEMELVDMTSNKVGDIEAQIHREVGGLNQELRSGERAAEDGGGPMLNSSPAEVRQMSADRGAIKDTEIPEDVGAVREIEVSARTSEEVCQMENEANRTTETLDQAVEEVVGAEEILPEPIEADTVKMSQKQENRDDRDDLALEPELLPDDKDGMKLEPEPLTNGMSDEMSNEIEETQRSEDIPGSQLESQSENAAESETAAKLGEVAEEHRAGFQNSGPVGIMPRRDMEQIDGTITPNMGREQETDHRVWSDNGDLSGQPNSRYGWDEKNVISIRKQPYEGNKNVLREPQTAHDPLNIGLPRQKGMVPNTRIPLQPDNIPKDKTVPRPDIITGPGMSRRHMSTGTVRTGSPEGQSNQEQMMDQCPSNQQPMSGQQSMPGQQPIPDQQQVPCQQPMLSQQSKMFRQLMPSNQTVPSRQRTPGQSLPGQHPVANRQSMPGQQAIQNQQPVSNQQPTSSQQLISSQRPIPDQQPMLGQRSISNQQLVLNRQPTSNQQPIPNHRPTSNQQPMLNQQPIPNHRPVPDQRPIPDQQPISNQRPVPNQQPMSNHQPLPNQRPGNQIQSQGRQMRPVGSGADDNSKAAGQAGGRVPVVDAGREALILRNPQDLEWLEQEEQQSDFLDELWEGFCKWYPKIQALDSVNGCETLIIKPQDVGLFPGENWNYDSNSFLLYGYYNYRYLILARIGGETKGRAWYILGVSGDCYSNERYMTFMFDFPHFMLARKQPSQGGCFGYWCTDV